MILEEGQSFTVERRGLTLVMALTPASLRLLERRASLARASSRLVRALVAGRQRSRGHARLASARGVAPDDRCRAHARADPSNMQAPSREEEKPRWS